MVRKFGKVTLTRDFTAWDKDGLPAPACNTLIGAAVEGGWRAAQPDCQQPAEIRRVDDLTWRGWRITRTVVVWTATAWY